MPSGVSMGGGGGGNGSGARAKGGGDTSESEGDKRCLSKWTVIFYFCLYGRSGM